MAVNVGAGRVLEDDHMLGCLHYGARFPAKDLVNDGVGEGNQGCPKCDAGGYNFDIFDADSEMLEDQEGTKRT